MIHRPPTQLSHSAANDGPSVELPWRALLEHCWDVVHVLDENGHLRYISPSVERLLGYEPEEMIGRAGAEFVHPDDIPAALEVTERALRDGTGGRIELRLRHRDGSWRWVAASGNRIPGASPALLVVNSHDITERRAAERAHAAAEDRFRFLVEQSLVGIFIIRRERLLYVNPKLAEVFGRTPEELVALGSVLEIVAEDDRERVERSLRTPLEDGMVTESYRFRGCRPDGHFLVVEVHGAPAELDGERVVVGVCQDVSERVRWESELRESEERYRRLFEDDLTGDVVCDPDGRVYACNRAYAEIFGFGSIEEAKAANAGERFARRGDRQRFLLRLAREGRVVGEELELRRVDGTPVHVLQNAVAVFDDHGELVRIRQYVFDITDRVAAAEALRESEERFRLVFRATNDVIWDLTVPVGRLSFNGIASAVLRYRPDELEEITVEWWYDRIHPDDRERVVDGFHQAMNGVDSTWTGEYRFRRGDGTYAVILDRGYVVRDRNGAPTRMVGSMLDVTERHRVAEVQRLLVRVGEVLDESLDCDTMLASLAALVVPVMGDDCLIDRVDPDSEEIRRVASAHVNPIRREALQGTSPPSSGEQPDVDPLLQVLRSGHPMLVPRIGEEEGDAPGRGTGHGAAWRELGLCSYLIVPLATRDRILGAVTLAACESGRHFGPVDLLLAENLARRTAMALDSARLFEEARDAVRARDEVLSTVSQELRDPLGAIRESAALALEAAGPRPEIRRPLRTIGRSASRMEDLIVSLLDVSRLEGGRPRLDHVPPSAADRQGHPTG